MIEDMYGVNYKHPKVYLLQETGIGVAEFAGRTAYDSFDNSENNAVKIVNQYIDREDLEYYQYDDMINHLNLIPDSELLNQLAWVHHHHSVIEHATLSFLIKGTSRGVLQEHARHRIQSLTVRSTRYTMNSILNAYVSSMQFNCVTDSIDWFVYKLCELDILVTQSSEYNAIEYTTIYNKLSYQYKILGDEFINLAIAKSSISFLDEELTAEELFSKLEGGKKKRNVGDAFKHIVTDNWKVDMVVTFNLRSLKNYFDLRDSGAAYFQIRWLAEAMKKVTPKKYLKLIDKKVKDEE